MENVSAGVRRTTVYRGTSSMETCSSVVSGWRSSTRTKTPGLRMFMAVDQIQLPSNRSRSSYAAVQITGPPPTAETNNPQVNGGGRVRKWHTSSNTLQVHKRAIHSQTLGHHHRDDKQSLPHRTTINQQTTLISKQQKEIPNMIM